MQSSFRLEEDFHKTEECIVETIKELFAGEETKYLLIAVKLTIIKHAGQNNTH